MGLGISLSLSPSFLLSLSIPLFMVKSSANFLLITLMMVLCEFMLTSAVCFLTLQFGNSRKCTHTHMRKYGARESFQIKIPHMHYETTTTSSLVQKKKTSKIQESFRACISVQVAWYPQCSVTIHAQICWKWEIMKEGKAKGKLGKERRTSFSPSEVSALSLHNCNTEKESDRQIYPTSALCFCFRCIIHLCANLEEPSQSPN